MSTTTVKKYELDAGEVVIQVFTGLPKGQPGCVTSFHSCRLRVTTSHQIIQFDRKRKRGPRVYRPLSLPRPATRIYARYARISRLHAGWQDDSCYAWNGTSAYQAGSETLYPQAEGRMERVFGGSSTRSGRQVKYVSGTACVWPGQCELYIALYREMALTK